MLKKLILEEPSIIAYFINLNNNYKKLLLLKQLDKDSKDHKEEITLQRSFKESFFKVQDYMSALNNAELQLFIKALKQIADKFSLDLTFLISRERRGSSMDLAESSELVNLFLELLDITGGSSTELSKAISYLQFSISDKEFNIRSGLYCIYGVANAGKSLVQSEFLDKLLELKHTFNEDHQVRKLKANDVLIIQSGERDDVLLSDQIKLHKQSSQFVKYGSKLLNSGLKELKLHGSLDALVQQIIKTESKVVFINSINLIYLLESTKGAVSRGGINLQAIYKVFNTLNNVAERTNKVIFCIYRGSHGETDSGLASSILGLSWGLIKITDGDINFMIKNADDDISGTISQLEVIKGLKYLNYKRRSQEKAMTGGEDIESSNKITWY